MSDASASTPEALEPPDVLGPGALDAGTCPRCHQPMDERFYGPCESCRAQLRAKLSGEQSSIDAVEYEPKMNVTPNAIASKE